MGKGNKHKKNFKKIPTNEFFVTTTSVPDKENRGTHNSQGLKRRNDGERSHNFQATLSTTVASSCEIDRKIDNTSLNDSGIDNVHESYKTESANIENINTKATPALTEQNMTKLDVGLTKEDTLGFGLNADAAEFVPTHEKFTTNDASVSCSTTSYLSTTSSHWEGQPPTDSKSSLSDSTGCLSHQTGSFSNSNRHQHRNYRHNNHKPINAAGNFENNQSQYQEKQITRESYTPPLEELHQKRESNVQKSCVSQSHRNTNYMNSKDHKKAQINEATRSFSREDSKDNSGIILISDSDSESTENCASRRSKKHRSRKNTNTSKSRDSSGNHDEKLSYRSKSREKKTIETKHKHRSKSRNKNEKSDAEGIRSGSETKTHRSKSREKKTTKEKQKHRSKSRDKKEKSDAEGNYSRTGGKHRTECRRKQSSESEIKVDDSEKSRRKNVPSRSSNFDKNDSFQNREYGKRNKKHHDSFAGSTEEYLENDSNSTASKTKDETSKNDNYVTSRNQIRQSSNRTKSYDTNRSDSSNSRNDNISQDSQEWQQVKGSKSRGAYPRKPQMSKPNTFNQRNARHQESSVDQSENFDNEGKNTTYQNRTQINKRGTYSYNGQKPLDRQAEIGKSGYNPKNHIQPSVKIPNCWEDKVEPDCNRRPSKNVSSSWKSVGGRADIDKSECITSKTQNQLAAHTSQGNWNVILEPDCSRQANENVDPAWGGTFPEDVGSSTACNFSANLRQSLDSYSGYKNDRLEPQRKSLGEERQTKRLRDPRMERTNWRDNSQTEDQEFEDFLAFEKSNEEMKYVRIEEKSGDLFEMPKEYSLAHCVAEDLSMGSGIAVQFKRDFKGLGELYDQRQKQGGLAFLEQQHGDLKRYIYYLVTKRESSGKPTYFTFWSSVKKMRDHIRHNNVKKLAIPRIGCGLDRLEWSRVKFMVEFLFKDVDIEIVVCNFQQDDGTPTKELRGAYCKVIREKYHITQLENYSIILYFSTEDGFISDEMLALQKKFNFIPQFNKDKKMLGEVVRFEDRTKNYVLYGCIVRRNMKQPFQFTSFVKCLSQINKQNKKDSFEYVGIPAVRDQTDYLLNFKIVNTAKTYLRNVDIYQCFGNEEDDKSLKDTENEKGSKFSLNDTKEENVINSLFEKEIW